MLTQTRKQFFRLIALGSLLASVASTSIHAATQKESATNEIPGRYNGWVVGFDNDILVPGGRDQDYTYGLNVSFIGDKSRNHLLASHGLLGRSDDLFNLFDESRYPIRNSSIEYGVFAFTPEDTSIRGVDQEDRPYASLVFTSSANERLNAAQDQAVHTSLTLGILGLDIVGDLQDATHAAIGNDRPEGWDNQISKGGEPTFRYTAAKQKLLTPRSSSIELKQTYQGSVGYITEAGYSLGLRFGHLNSPWVSFNPELATYGEKSTASSSLPGRRIAEHYFWAGVSVKARAYNVFLQGQFRDSEHTFGGSDLNHVIGEAWVGYTVALNNGYAFSYYVRGHTSEVKDGVGSRNLVWGGLRISRNFQS